MFFSGHGVLFRSIFFINLFNLEIVFVNTQSRYSDTSKPYTDCDAGHE